jgi:hypothetical protein
VRDRQPERMTKKRTTAYQSAIAPTAPASAKARTQYSQGCVAW